MVNPVRANYVEELLVEQIAPLHDSEVRKAGRADRLVRGSKDSGRRFGKRDTEKATLWELSHTSLLALIIQYSAQQIIAEGFTAGAEDMQLLWQPFDRNGFPSWQGALWRSVLTYGVGYGLTLAGNTGAYVRAFSPKRFGALYGDTVDDDFPMWAWRVIPQAGGEQHWRVYDDRFIYFVARERDKFVFLEACEHGLGVVPVVKFANSADLEGNAVGEPDKYRIDVARHNKTVEDRLKIQHYNSWRTTYAIKMADDVSEEEREQFRLKLEQDDILIGSGETEFGTLDETDLGPMKAAQESDRDLLAAVSQTPVWAFNGGSMVNLSADALIEAKSGNRQKVSEIQRGFGRTMCDWGRVAARAEERVEDESRFDLAVYWADINSVSLSAAADSLGKLAVQLGVPVEMLWEMIPGVTNQQVQAWREYASQNPAGDSLLASVLNRQMSSIDG